MNRRRFIALTVGALACVGGGALLRPVRRNADATAVRRRADSIGEAHGLYIGYGAPDTFFVAPFGSRDAIIPDGAATAADVDAIPVALDGIEQAG